MGGLHVAVDLDCNCSGHCWRWYRNYRDEPNPTGPYATRVRSSLCNRGSGKEEFDPPVVKELDCYQFKMPGAPPVQYKIWIEKAECQVSYWDKNYYFELDFYRMRGRSIPVFVIASKRSLQTHRRILYILGGPRLVLTYPNDVMKTRV